MNQDKRLGWLMPAWLVDWEMERDPEGWISRALRWGWVEEAVDWVTQLVGTQTPPELLPKGRADVAVVPYALVDRVLVAAREGVEKDEKRVQVKVKALEDEVRRRTEGLERLRDA
jgi:nuclear pore complex protein Nup160